jgi:hypothetical protein
MSAVAEIFPAADGPAPTRLPIGERAGGGELVLELEKLMAGRLLIQGSSGAGKSQTLRRIVEEAFEYLPVMIVDPEGEFGNLAAHIGAFSMTAAEYSAEGLTAAAMRGRRHSLSLHLDLSDLSPDERIVKAAAFFAGLISAPREEWGHTVLVAIDEAHLLAPHVAATSRDAETRRLGVATLAELCSRGRKRGVAAIVATQRLAKLATSVTSELHNALVGLNVFDRDVARAADLLGFSGDRAESLKRLSPGEFYALGPALSYTPVKALIGPTVTAATGAAPAIRAPSDMSLAEAETALDLEALRETGAEHAAPMPTRGAKALDGFLMHPSAAAAARILEALRPIAPNAATAADLARALALTAEAVDAGLDLLIQVAAVDAMPRGETRIARLAARLRLRGVEAAVVAL